MFKNLLTVSLRNLKRQKGFSILHILGLTLGLSSCILVGLFTIDELSFDKFHENGENIYRINQTFIWGDEDALFGSTGPAVMNAVMAEVPEFVAMARVHTPSQQLVTYNPPNGDIKVFEEENVLAADSNFFSIFTFPLIEGNPNTALLEPNSLVITHEMSKKYFGDEPGLGKQLQIEARGKTKSFKVTGVAQDIPTQSHIQFDMLLSMNSFPRVKQSGDSWMWTTFVTFGLLREDADPELVAEKVAQVPGKYLGPFLEKYRGISYEEFKASGEEWNLYIQPFLDIHLYSTHVYSRLNDIGDIKMVYILILVGTLILGISLINFINLSTARATSRAKEVGIRKVIGSGRKLLIYQFLTESTVYAAMAMVLSVLLVELILPSFNLLVDKSISFNLMDVQYILVILAVVLIIGFLSGLYPSFYLSSFQPAQVLKGSIARGLKGGSVRNILVVVQFTISIALLASTLVIYNQVRYWQNMDVGFDRENKIIIENVERLGQQQEVYKNQLMNNSLVENVTYSTDTPPYIFDFDNFNVRGAENQISVNYLKTDENFLDVFGIALLHGRNFSEEFNEKYNAIVSVSLTKSFGFGSPEDALNEYLLYGDNEYKIVGIMSDFNANLSDQLYPTAFFDKDASIFGDPTKEFSISLKRELAASEMKNLLASFEAEWITLNEKIPFEYSFVDQEYLQVFDSTIRFGSLMRWFSVLTIIIACLGLIGLITYIIEKRIKEIGIRKVLGASITSILLLLSSNFGKLLLISFILATPVSYLVMNQWLDSYPMRISISAMTFIFSGGIMLIISLLAVSYQTIKASLINPVEYLKEE